MAGGRKIGSREIPYSYKAVKEQYGTLKDKVKESGINDFVSNANLPVVRKNKSLEKTEK